MLAGPCPAIDAEDPGPAGFSGSLVVAEFGSLEGGPRLGRCRPVHRSGRLQLASTSPVQAGPPLMLAREQRVDAIRAAIESALAPVLLEIEDESHKHAGHAGARDGRGHFRVDVVSSAFVGMSPHARHRAVYAAVGS
jgi:BolA protein